MSLQLDLIELKPYKTRNCLWMAEIFGTPVRKFDGSLKVDTFPVFIVQGNVTIDSKDRSINFKLFSKLESIGCCFGLINVEDENYDHDLSVYSLKKCLFVFREYYRSRGGVIQFGKNFVRSFLYPTHHTSTASGYSTTISNVKSRVYGNYGVLSYLFRQYLPFLADADKVFNIPLGYTDRVGELLHSGCNIENPITGREYKWSFCGESNKSDRFQMLTSLKDTKPSYVYRSDESGQTRMLSGKEYWEVMLQSIFVPCPFGNINVDTYRLFEALEAGSIPVMVTGYAYQPYDYYTLLLGTHPIPTFPSWTHASDFIENADSDTILNTAQKIQIWYKMYKENLIISINNSISKYICGNGLTSDVNNLNSVTVPQ